MIVTRKVNKSAYDYSLNCSFLIHFNLSIFLNVSEDTLDKCDCILPKDYGFILPKDYGFILSNNLWKRKRSPKRFLISFIFKIIARIMNECLPSNILSVSKKHFSGKWKQVNIILRVSFSPGRDSACRHFCILSFWTPPGKTVTVQQKKVGNTWNTNWK